MDDTRVEQLDHDRLDADRLSADQRRLLDRIDGLVLDQPGASLAFTDRLARENGWTRVDAARVVAEYRRFLFLAAAAGHPVTPSDEVDQAWHLHLVYTRSYWDELCGEVLGFPLHHGPTVGGAAEGQKFTDWYERTLDSYRRLFGEEPPADIWPASADRFADADRFRRINTADHWVVPRPGRRGGTGLGRGGGPTDAATDGSVPARRLRSRTAALAAGAALTLTGCLAASASNPALLASTTGDGGGAADWVAFAVILVVIVGFFVGLGLAIARSSNRSRDRARRSGAWWGASGCGGDAGSGCGTSGCGSSGCGGGGCGGCGG